MRQLKSDLEAANLSVWLDTEIPAGSEWPREIGLALQNCKALIAVVTKKYVCSRYCKCELYVACDKHKDIFPLIYEDGWTECEEGAGVRYMISAYNWTFFRPNIDGYSASLQKLIGGLKGTQTAETSPATSSHRGTGIVFLFHSLLHFLPSHWHSGFIPRPSPAPECKNGEGRPGNKANFFFILCPPPFSLSSTLFPFSFLLSVLLHAVFLPHLVVTYPGTQAFHSKFCLTGLGVRQHLEPKA